MNPSTTRAAASRRASGPLAVVAVVSALLLLVQGCSSGDPAPSASDSTAPGLSGYRREPTPSVAEVSLPDAAGGGDVEISARSGGLRVVYFGYTSCPDVCPTTMADLKRALASLPAERSERVDFLMVTVDPERDVAEKMEAYVTTFIEGGASARTTDDAVLRAAAEPFGVDYSVTTTEDGEIEVSHTAELYAVDDAGKVVLQWPFGTTSESLASDIDQLLDEASAT